MIKRMVSKVKNFFIRKRERIKAKKLNCYIDKKAKISGTIFEGDNKVYNAVILNSIIGDSSYIGNDSFFVNTYIGKFCSISNDVKLVLGRHNINCISTHPKFFSTKNIQGNSFVTENTYKETAVTNNGYSLEIGNDVWIGFGARIKEGVKIGDGSVIAMGSVIVNDVPPYSVVGGVPAKIIKYRFSKDIINELLDIKWWNCNKTDIMKNYPYFDKIEMFIEKIRELKGD